MFNMSEIAFGDTSLDSVAPDPLDMVPRPN